MEAKTAERDTLPTQPGLLPVHPRSDPPAVCNMPSVSKRILSAAFSFKLLRAGRPSDVHGDDASHYGKPHANLL